MAQIPNVFNNSAMTSPMMAPRAAAPNSHYPPGVVPDPDALRNLIVNYLPPLMDEAQVCQLFSQFGPIESVKIIYDKETRESRGYGFVKFFFFFSATYAVSCLDRFSIAGKHLKVAYADAERAREALEELKADPNGGFSDMQRAALSDMYYQQSLLNPPSGAD